MAQFHGLVAGQRGEATRLGSKASGLRTNAAGWKGAIQVSVYEEDGVDKFQVFLTPHQGSGGATTMIAEGLLDARVPQVKA